MRGCNVCVRARNECEEGRGRLCAVLYTRCTSTPILLYVPSLVRVHQRAGNVGSLSVSIFQSRRVISAPRADKPVVTLTGEDGGGLAGLLARVSMMGILEVSYPGFPGLFSPLSLSLSLSSSTFIPP